MVLSNDHRPARSSRTTWADDGDIEQLLTHFDRLMQTPESVQRLRRFILDLAVRGKLVPQDPGDEPAAELLKRIAAEKARLVKTGEIRKERTEPVLSGDRPFKLPASWCWVAFGELHTLIRGVTYSKSDVSDSAGEGYLPILRANNIAIHLNHEDPVFVKRERISPGQFLRRGDFMIALSSGSKNLVGKAAFVPNDFDEGFGGFCGVIRLTHTSLQGFVGAYLQSNLYRDSIAAGSRGIGINNLKKEKLSNLHFPLPPLAEQHRIVAKVDELMGLCDRLEAARAERETTRTRLAAASLARLNAPDPDQATFREHVAFVLNNLAPMTTRPEQVKALRQTILNLAVRGKLVEQNPGDEPVMTLLKRQKITVSCGGTFEVPTSWAWVKVGAVAETRLGKMLDKAKNKGTLRRYLRNINVRWFDFELSDLLKMRFEDSELQEFALQFGDVMVCEGGEPGRAAVWDDRESNIYFQKAIHRVRFLNSVDSAYFVKALRASADDGRLAEYFTGTGIKHFTGRALKSYLFPLPPLAEQHRIVTKVNELMAVCDRLEASLEDGDDGRGRLLGAMLHEALEPDGNRRESSANLPDLSM